MVLSLLAVVIGASSELQIAVDVIAHERPVQEVIEDLFKANKLPAPAFRGDWTPKVSAKFFNVPVSAAVTRIISPVGGVYSRTGGSVTGELPAFHFFFDERLLVPMDLKAAGDVKDVLKTFMTKVDVSYAIEAGVYGKITAESTGAPATQVLCELLKTIHASYYSEGGVIFVTAGKQPPDSRDWLTGVFNYQDRPLSEILSRLARGMQCTINVSKSVDLNAKVTINLAGVSFEQVLQASLKQVGATYRVLHGCYEIIPKTH